MESSIGTLQTQAMGIWQYFNAAVGQAIAWGPKLIAAVAVLAVAYVIARALGYAFRYAIDRTPIGKRSVESGASLGHVIGRAIFWIVILIALPAVLNTLGLTSLVEPMQTMAERFLAFLPSLIGAVLIFGIGWAVAAAASRTVTSLLEAAQTDAFAERYGLARVTGQAGVSNFFGVLVFTLLIIPIAIAALDTLAINSISVPAKEMLTGFLLAIPNIFAAAIVLLLAYIIGKFASDTLAKLLPPLGFDNVGAHIGLTEEVFGDNPPSALAGYVAFFTIMVFGIIEAAKLLNFAIVSNLLAQIITLGGQILLGAAIIAFGVLAADFIHKILLKSRIAGSLAGFMRVAIIVLAAAMGLRQMGVANDIINIGFGMLLGALAIGAAVAIGWGGKDTAGRLLEKWTSTL